MNSCFGTYISKVIKSVKDLEYALILFLRIGNLIGIVGLPLFLKNLKKPQDYLQKSYQFFLHLLILLISPSFF